MSVLHLTLKQPAQAGDRARSDAVRDPGRARGDADQHDRTAAWHANTAAQHRAQAGA